LRNTDVTILENWQGPLNPDPPNNPVYHFAVKQVGVNLDFHLEKFFRDNRIAIHYFSNMEGLITVCQRFSIDLIVMGSREDFTDEIQLVRLIKRNVFLDIIPIIVYHPDPKDTDIVAAYQNGVEDFIHGMWMEKLVEVRIRRVIERSRRDLSVNPSTRLPGPTVIEREIRRQIGLQEEFAICYADLDNFKAYNDYYGYYYGDKVIQLTARVIKDIVFDLCRGGFVGHIAGDDFIYIISPDVIDSICTRVISTFDALIPYRYAEEDRTCGFITTTNRRGEIEQFPILSMSIAVITNSNGTFSHPGELSKMLADLKKAVKAKDGSNYMVERRQKY
jgi:GGDEF domain-containing protein